jgi:hypothetical protein
VIEDILGMEEGELKLVLRGLSSLMKDENDKNGGRLNKGVISYVIPHFAHASCSIQVARAHSMSIDRNMKTRLLYGALHSLCN